MNNAQISKHDATKYEQVLPKEAQPGQQAPTQQPQMQTQQGQPQYQQAAPAQDPRLQKWVEANSWFNKDEEMTNLTLGIHKNLVNNLGISPHSEEYYNRVDSRLREINPRFFGVDENKGTVEPTASHVPLVVASAGRTSASGPKTVRITTSARDLATRLGITEKQYALQVLADERKKNG
jgi:hypothetical protein